MAETEYRKSTTPTAWNRYLTLGCYTVDGFLTFDTIMEESTTEHLKMHCLIWFQYAYQPSRLQTRNPCNYKPRLSPDRNRSCQNTPCLPSLLIQRKQAGKISPVLNLYLIRGPK